MNETATTRDRALKLYTQAELDRAVAEAVRLWREALSKVVTENCEACGGVYPKCQDHVTCEATFAARTLLSPPPPASQDDGGVPFDGSLVDTAGKAAKEKPNA